MIRTLRPWVPAIAALLVLLGGCEASARGRQQVDLSGFDSVSLDCSGELILTQSDGESLEIEAGAADLARIVTEVRGGTLYIGRRGKGFSFRPPVFRLAMRNVTALETHSSGRIAAKDLRAESLRVRVTSSGGISIDSLTAKSLSVEITSSGSVSVGGSVEQQEARLTSSGDYKARNLASNAATVRVSSSGSATLRVSDSLEANITSSGSVRYYGSPPKVSGNVTSSGRLIKAGD